MVTTLCLCIFIHITTRGLSYLGELMSKEGPDQKHDFHLKTCFRETLVFQLLGASKSLRYIKRSRFKGHSPTGADLGQSNLKEESWCHCRTNNPRGDGFLSKGQALVRGQDAVGELPHTGQTRSQTKPSSSHKNSNGIVGR